MALVVKNLAANVGDIKGMGQSIPGHFNPWVRKIPWRRTWKSTPVFLPRESYGQRSLVDCHPQGCKESDMTEAT